MNLFVMDCWQEGEGKDVCCSAIYGICALLGLESKQAFKHSWKLLKKWGSLELPLQAPPAQREEALGLAGQAWSEGLIGIAVMILIAFDLFLRTGEFLSVEVAALTGSVAHGLVIDLGETKGVKRRGGRDIVTCTDPELCALAFRVKGLRAGCLRVAELEAKAFSKWMRKTMQNFDLSHRQLTPYSFRRGGLSSACLAGVPVSTLALRARWWDIRTAKEYIHEGAASLGALQVTPEPRMRLRQAAANLGR